MEKKDLNPAQPPLTLEKKDFNPVQSPLSLENKDLNPIQSPLTLEKKDLNPCQQPSVMEKKDVSPGRRRLQPKKRTSGIFGQTDSFNEQDEIDHQNSIEEEYHSAIDLDTDYISKKLNRKLFDRQKKDNDSSILMVPPSKKSVSYEQLGPPYYPDDRKTLLLREGNISNVNERPRSVNYPMVDDNDSNPFPLFPIKARRRLMSTDFGYGNSIGGYHGRSMSIPCVQPNMFPNPPSARANVIGWHISCKCKCRCGPDSTNKDDPVKEACKSTYLRDLASQIAPPSGLVSVGGVSFPRSFFYLMVQLKVLCVIRIHVIQFCR